MIVAMTSVFGCGAGPNFRRLAHRVLAVTCALLTCLGLMSAAAAQAFKSRAQQAILMEASTGAVLYQHNADKLVSPASMSKLMTLVVIFKALKQGTLKLEDTFTVSEHAWRTGGAPSGTSAMFAGLGKQISVSDLLQGIAIQSGNDACIVVAEGMAGTEAAFAKKMTTEARAIGLVKSTFGNPTGLPHPDQKMTVREIALLAQHIIQTYPEFYHYFSKRRFPYQPEGRRKPYAFFNRNPLLSLDIGADGLKTGHLKESGYGLVGSAVQDGRRLIVVVHGLKTARDRKEEAAKLLEWGFRNFTDYKMFDEGAEIGSARVWGGEKFYVSLTGKGPVSVILPKFPAKPKIKAEVVYQGPLKAPIKKGAQVAFLRVTTSNNAVNEVPLYAAEDIPEGGIVRSGLDSMFHLALRWVGDQASGLISGL